MQQNLSEGVSVISGYPAQVRYPNAGAHKDDIALVPYARVGGEWTLSSGVLLGFAARAANEHVLETVFADGAVRTPQDFLEMMQEPDNVPIFVFSGQECVAAGWLNGCAGNAALGHFIVLRAGRGEIARQAGKLVLNYWCSFRVLDKPLFDVILGIIPSENYRAIRFAREIGLTELGEIPKLLHGKPATLLYLAR
jgi:hypothetical protein